MAPPLNFKPQPLELNSAYNAALERAHQEHTEALLSLYALLQEAHDHGWLDAARGIIAGAPVAAAEIAKFANTGESIAMMRNIVSLAKILGSIDPEVLHAVSLSISDTLGKDACARKPSLWSLFRSVASSDVLRGAVVAFGIITVVGKALGRRR